MAPISQPLQLVIALVIERVVLNVDTCAALAFRLFPKTTDPTIPVEADIPDKKYGLGCRLGKLPVDPFK